LSDWVGLILSGLCCKLGWIHYGAACEVQDSKL
jgi:hypothetical protein